MSQNKIELDMAWAEVTFWQDFVVWWNTEQHKSPEPRVMEALEKAWMRYERALQFGNESGTLVKTERGRIHGHEAANT